MTGARPLFVLAMLGWWCGTGLLAFEPELPFGARLTAERASDIDSVNVPMGAFDGESVPSLTLEGAVDRRAWRVDARDLTPLQVIIPLRQQLEADGYALAFQCEAFVCGGFDFRFGVEVLPGPNMYVNISRYHYLTALRGEAQTPDDAINVFVSVTADAAYIQIISVTRAQDPVVVPPARQEPTESEETSDWDAQNDTADAEVEGLGEQLLSQGRVVLADLDFAQGTSDLGPGPFSSLEALAQLLETQPQLRIVLVGHTDTTGNLAPNISVSRARALSVRERLISEFGADASQLDAEGMGYLAPVAPNLTPEGRRSNRRVEAVLLNTQ